MARWWRRGAPAPILTPAPPARDSAPVPAQPDTAPVQRAEWRDVPPLRPVVTAISPVAAPGSFARTLASWQNPSFLQPLGHAVDPAGPAGVVDGLAVSATQRTKSGDADLPVATRAPAGSATAQRTAGPWPGVAESPVAVGTGAAHGEPFAGNGFTADAWDEPRTLSVAPSLPDGGALTVAPDLPVRSTLPAVPRPAASSSPTAAPGTPTLSRSVADDGLSDDGSEPRAASADLERSAATDAAEHHSPGAAQHGPDAVSDAVAEAPQAPGRSGQPPAATGLAPLVGDPAASPTGAGNASDDGAADSDHRTTDLADTSGTAMPLAAASLPTAGSARPSTTVQRAADRAHRAPGLGAPLPTAPIAPTGTGLRPGESPAAQPLQRADSRSADLRLPPVQRAVAAPAPSSTSSAPVPAASAARPPAAQGDLENPVEQSEASSASTPTAPLVGSARLMRVIDPADSGAEAGRAAGADGHAGTPAATLPTASSAGAPSLSSSVPSSPRPRHGSPTAMDVQRTVGGDLPSEKARPGAELMAEPADGPADSAVRNTPPAGTEVAPTLGAASVRSGVSERQQESSEDRRDSSGRLPVATHLGPDLSGAAPQVQRFAETPATDHVTDGSASSAPTARPDQHFETADPVAAPAPGDLSAPGLPLRLIPLLGERASPRLALGTPIGPSVQRVAAPEPWAGQAQSDRRSGPSDGSGGGATRGHATGFPPPSVAVQRSQSAAPAPGARPGLGAAVPTVPASIGHDAVSVRAMSLEQMFAPGAAAIASGAAHGDGAGSVVFHALTVDESAEWPSVQRFGLPGADVLSGASTLADRAKSAGGGLLGSARSAAGSYADTARNAAGGYADTARNAAGSYADTARNAAGGYADTARNAAGSYADTARNTAGSYADTARNAVGGYADSARTLAGGYGDAARGAAGSAVDAAQTAAGDAAGAARGVAGQAVDSAQSAASGAGDAAQNAIATAAGAAGGAIAGAAGTAANALPTDLDELARRLFDPLSARLKSELWLDRERAGMVTDLRR